MANTKEKILENSLTLLNEQGLKHTTLQSIANEVSISVGNLAYHYKNKQEIIAAHSIDLSAQLKEALTHYRNYPNFLDFYLQLEQIFPILDRYRYLFVNLGEIVATYPDTFKIIQTFTDKLLTQIESRLEYHYQKGTLLFTENQMIGQLASLLTHTILSSQMRRVLEPQLSIQDHQRDIWFLLHPYLTEIGQQEWTLLISPTLAS